VASGCADGAPLLLLGVGRVERRPASVAEDTRGALSAVPVASVPPRPLTIGAKSVEAAASTIVAALLFLSGRPRRTRADEALEPGVEREWTFVNKLPLWLPSDSSTAISPIASFPLILCGVPLARRVDGAKEEERLDALEARERE
jgi:hypothetical protein